MAFDRAKTSLGFVEEKLAKLLGLAGQISASFTPEIKPVVSMANLNDPGYSAFRGRHWAYASDLIVPGAANTTFGLRFGVACIVEAMWVAGSPIDGGGAGVNTRFPVHYVSPGVATPFPALARNTGTWTDQKLTEGDLPPLFDNVAPQVDAPSFGQLTITNRVWVAGFAGGSILNGLMATPPSWRGMHCPANATLRCPTTLLGVGTSLTFGVMGRIA